MLQDNEGKYCADPANVLYRIRPEIGMAILFNHHRLHEATASLQAGIARFRV